ncbi:xanthine dehydrogenase family protein molybdopterin-binding subunit [Ktedonosporobacter rubrisoli]|uniref:Xanthine dehydrogenase family protein molybdopterin-binding subunit n=1 Tax=Ktedonosporobacter rubrisoli TaxID=2509675 RepID=A0A4P6JR21_KTERU|nr:xanthine dehydrogenase family protein molybdopterin-binding subunit [Ktedonosporobacter rubrisoli]QBD77622.1 xanthine dehydrogenase family protein molybdopterin-binding subunit [Ktedonosporobacter rubrisoli]
MSMIGQRVRRRVDPRMLRGKGQYVADLRLPGMLHAAFVRSPYAHARIVDIDVTAAKKMPGVAAIFCANDTEFPALPLLLPHPSLKAVTQQPFSREVAHVGEPVALVLADSRYHAEDACEAIDITYEPLEAVVTVQGASSQDAALAHTWLESNLAASFVQNVGEAQAALNEAPIVVSLEMAIGRVSCMPIECRGLLASWSAGLGQSGLTVYASTQVPHMMRRIYADMFDLPELSIRVVAPDVGGGFGAKEPFYVEDFLIAWAAKEADRPVSWIEDRMENLQVSVHEREQHHRANMGLTRTGEILAVTDSFMANTGAYVPWGVVVPLLTSTLIPGPYKVPNYYCQAEIWYTNTTPLAPYRGAGRPQAALIINRLLDKAADQLGIDPAELRFKNLIKPDEFPYNTGLLSRDGTAMQLDSGNYQALLNSALEQGQYWAWRKKQKAGSNGKLVGIGLSMAIENTAIGPHEGATVTIESNGDITIKTGAASQGQAHETTLAQIAATVFHTSLERVHVREGDTALIPYGTGTFASRTAVVAGSAIQLASEKVRQKLLALAAHMLEASAEDLELVAGVVQVRGAAQRSISFAQLARLASGRFPGATFTYPIEPGLNATEYFTPSGSVYAAAAHLAVVEVDAQTGRISILDYTAIHDCGTILNPLVVDGQVMGGVVAGIGTAMFEEVRYDEQGQLLTSTLVDYLMPAAAEMPDIKVAHIQTPTPLNPLGAKGAGEGGAIPSPAAIVAAVEDALRPFQVSICQIPVTPQRIQKLINAAKKQAMAGEEDKLEKSVDE